MRKNREINFYKVIMIAIIISFSFLFAGVIGLNVEVKDVNNSFTTPSVSEGEGEKEITYLNWTEKGAEWNNYSVQTDIKPSESLTSINGVYQINSLADWLFATTYTRSRYSLNCDIVLNDGYFDDDGTYHDGGDGVCYVAYPFHGGSNPVVKGNGHTIKGFYIDDSKMPDDIRTEKGGRALSIFRPENTYEAIVRDLYIENIYLHSVSSGWSGAGTNAIQYSADCANVHILSGTLKSAYGVYGFCDFGSLKNCTNRANIYGNVNSTNTSSTTAFSNRATVMNCINYGKIDAGNGGARGIGGTVANSKNYGKITGGTAVGIGGATKDCINYGEVIGETSAQGIGGSNLISNCVNYGKVTSASGIASGITSGKIIQVIDCKNYGEVSGSSYAGGIVGCTYQNDFVISNSLNYGNIVGLKSSSYLGGIVGCVGNEWNLNTRTNVIKNCTVECNFFGSSSRVGNFIGCLVGSKNTTIKNSKAYTSEFIDTEFGFIIGQCGNGYAGNKNDNILVKNCDIVVNAKNQGLNYLIVRNILGNTTFDGVVVKEKNGSSSPLLIKSSTGEETYKSLIIDRKNYKNAIGKNFDAFYYKWKTGEIGVKTIDGNGFFQGEVDRQYLFNNKYLTSLEDEVEYIEVEYIESTGTQYIDTGIAITNENFNKFKIEIDTVFDVSGKTGGWLLDGVGDKLPYCYVGISSAGRLSYGTGTGDAQTTISMSEMRMERHKYVMDYQNKEIYVDDEKVVDCQIKDMTGNSFSQNFYLFAANSSTVRYFQKSRKYAVKLYIDGQIVRDFVPVIRNADQVVGLYDKVEGKFYKNIGSGNFLSGNIVK